jgi:hypothetical protein
MTFAIAPLASASGLGIFISFGQSGETDAEASGRIWGGGEAGSSFQRTMVIESLSTDTEQAISFEVNDQVTENETSFIDFSTPSRITDWVAFEPAAPVLGPGERVEVTITFNIPAGTNDGAFNANIRTFSSAAAPADLADSGAGTQAVIGTRLAIDAKVWVGVGDALALAPIFDIVGVDGALIDDEKFVRVFFENTGISPVQPEGRMQLSDPNFDDRIFEPINFAVPELQGGEIAFVDIPVAADLEDGFFRVFVTAQSGEVRITRLFEATLVFDDPNKLAILDLAIRIAGFVIAALGLVFGVRLIRGSSLQREPRTRHRRRLNQRDTTQMGNVTGLTVLDVDYRSDSRRELKDARPSMTRVADLPPGSWRDVSRPAKPVRPRFSFGSKVAVQQPAQEDPLETLRKAVSRISADVENYNATYHSPPRSEIKTQTKTLSQVKTAKPSDPKPRSAGSTTPAKKSPKGTGKAAVSPLNVAETTVSKTPTKRTPAPRAKPKTD